MVARFHLWLRNILVVNNRWRQYSIKIVLWLYSIASTSISLCKLGKYTIVYLMMLYSLVVVHGTPCIPSLTEFTDHQSHARIINSNACGYPSCLHKHLLWNVCGMLNFDTYA